MTEFDPGIERERPRMSAISRYYTDMRDVNNSYATILVSLDTMLQSLPFKTRVNLESLQTSVFLPQEWQVENEPRIANEKLALLPLAHLGPQLDTSDCSTDEMRDWYDDAIKGVRALTRDDHDTSCLESGNLMHMMCQKSTVCPERFMERYFSDEVMNPDFDSPIYESNPRRGYAIAYGKCNLAAKYNVVTKEHVAGAMGSYTRKYIEHFNANPEQSYE